MQKSLKVLQKAIIKEKKVKKFALFKTLLEEASAPK